MQSVLAGTPWVAHTPGDVISCIILKWMVTIVVDH